MARHSFMMRSKHIGTKENVMADAASRDDWARFYEHAHEVYGLTPEQMHRVPVTLDVPAVIARMQRAHVAARLRGEEQQSCRARARRPGCGS